MTVTSASLGTSGQTVWAVVRDSGMFPLLTIHADEVDALHHFNELKRNIFLSPSTQLTLFILNLEVTGNFIEMERSAMDFYLANSKTELFNSICISTYPYTHEAWCNLASIFTEYKDRALSNGSEYEEYKITWRVELDALSPREAALQARAMLLDIASDAVVFEVADSGQVSTSIDLQAEPITVHELACLIPYTYQGS
ncbi:hypothetical protein BOO92_15855 [Vibrio navarrensis]|uniref:hypothetical protein n=1 Tax=Vibrio navarrensis TaxID=29495 RepID=UPI0018669004|nr:hypothetical protein [Vibrio navarrensis]MBE3658154.1 hypothetical protein [Vibrio navarrensis]